MWSMFKTLKFNWIFCRIQKFEKRINENFNTQPRKLYKRNIIVNENIKGIINFVEKRNYYFTTSMLLIFHG